MQERERWGYQARAIGRELMRRTDTSPARRARAVAEQESRRNNKKEGVQLWTT